MHVINRFINEGGRLMFGILEMLDILNIEVIF